MDGALVVVGTPIGNLGDLSPRGAEALRSADAIACEDTRRLRGLLNHLGIETPPLIVVNEHEEAGRVDRIVERVAAGERVALTTDAGMPAISDPGELIVRGPVVTREYVTRKEANLKTKIAAGDEVWHRIGDVGYRDDDGRLWFSRQGGRGPCIAGLRNCRGPVVGQQRIRSHGKAQHDENRQAAENIPSIRRTISQQQRGNRIDGRDRRDLVRLR